LCIYTLSALPHTYCALRWHCHILPRTTAHYQSHCNILLRALLRALRAHYRAYCQTLPHTGLHSCTPKRALSHTSSRAHSRSLLHTAALLNSRTLPRALSYTTRHTAADRRRALPHTAARTAAHCHTAGQPHDPYVNSYQFA
jgi:hypothetical protein